MQGRVRRTATWFLANSCLRSGDTASAIQLLKLLDPAEANVQYTRYAAELLERITVTRDE